MNTRLHPGVVCLLALVVLYPLSLACARPVPPPQAEAPVPTALPSLLANGNFRGGASAWQAVTESGAPLLACDPAGFAVIAVAKAGSPHTAAWAQTVPVQAGDCYRISCRAHTERLVGVASLTLSFLDAEGRPLSKMEMPPLSGDSGWTAYARRCRAPDGAVQARIALQMADATAGRACFDDACLAPDDAPPVRALIVRYDGEPTAAAGPWPPLAQLQETPHRLVTEGDDDLGLTLLAGKSGGGRLVQVLISDSGSRSESYRLALVGFPPGYRYAVTEARVWPPATAIAWGDGAALQDGVLTSPWHAPATQLIRIEWP
ncbi:MAG TPA: hypothetical protein PLJ35_09570 [Anaerolineae bacterium]|nr:hypothetical protein [Anaerolineae bacterium]HOQ99058.1 hypothetical protein [Anaerolineae bacterium]HPL27822.1 hypothetical protein [Anaerolineae bacterium]